MWDLFLIWEVLEEFWLSLTSTEPSCIHSSMVSVLHTKMSLRNFVGGGGKWEEGYIVVLVDLLQL